MPGFRYAPPSPLFVPVVLVAVALSGCAALNPLHDVEPGPGSTWTPSARTASTVRPATATAPPVANARPPRRTSETARFPEEAVEAASRPRVARSGPSPSAGRHATSARTEVEARVALEPLLRDIGAPWLGTPYRYGGTTRSGIDCSGFVQALMRDNLGLALPRTTASQVQEGEEVDREDLLPGDLVFFNRRGVRHVGVYLGDGEFIHASSSRGVIVSKLDEDYYTRNYWTSRRVLNGAALLLATNPRTRRATAGEDSAGEDSGGENAGEAVRSEPIPERAGRASEPTPRRSSGGASRTGW